MLTTLCQCGEEVVHRKEVSPQRNLAAKASTQDGLDEDILEASLTISHQKGVVANQSHFYRVCAIKEVFPAGMGQGDINIPASYHPHVWATALSAVPLLPLFQLTSASSCLPSPAPHLLATLPSHPAAGPQQEKRAPNSELLPHQGFHFLLLSTPAIFPCPLPHTGNTQTLLLGPKPGQPPAPLDFSM